MSQLSIQELAALDDVVDATQDTVLPNGKVVTQHPIGIRNYIRHLVRPFPSVRKQFTKTSETMATVAAKIGATGGKETDEEAFMSAASGAIGGMVGDLVNARIDDGLDADIRFVALTLCKARTPQELKQVEGVVAGFSDSVFDALFQGAKAVTYGGDVKGFFARVRESLTKMEAMESEGA